MTNRQKVFIEEYLKCFNAAEAARRAGYKDNANLHTNAAKLLQNTTIAGMIAARLAELHMDTDEALTILAGIGRGDIGEFMDITADDFTFNFEQAKQRGLTKLIKEVERRKTTTKTKDGEHETIVTKLKLHDPQTAIEKVLRVKGKIKDPGVTIQKAYVGISPDDWDKVTDD
jgi:phage terminase small subunit